MRMLTGQNQNTDSFMRHCMKEPVFLMLHNDRMPSKSVFQSQRMPKPLPHTYRKIRTFQSGISWKFSAGVEMISRNSNVNYSLKSAASF